MLVLLFYLNQGHIRMIYFSPIDIVLGMLQLLFESNRNKYQLTAGTSLNFDKMTLKFYKKANLFPTWQIFKFERLYICIQYYKVHISKLHLGLDASKVRKTANIRKRYNQVPHLTQDITWENNKNTLNITNKSQEVSPFPAGEQGSNEQTRKLTKHKKHK